jgi:hypothetical protein
MPTPGRSFDDLPLAAYSTGVDPETESPAVEAALAAPAAVPQATAGPGVSVPGVLHLDGLDPAAALPVPEDEPKPPVPNVLVTRARAFAAGNPRILAGAAFVAVILVGLSMLLGGKGPVAAGASASPSLPPIAVVAAEPGTATLVLTGAVKGTFSMTGTAAQPVTDNLVGAAWGDTLQNVLALQGKVDRGTRTTDAQLVLTWGLMVEGKLVTFTSKAGECTIGMTSNAKAVSGSFACRKLKSDDGKLTVAASGTYRT